MGKRLVKDPKGYGSYLFWVPNCKNNIPEMEKITDMGKFTVKSTQGKMLSQTHANLMLHTIDKYIKDYKLEKNAFVEFSIYDLAVNGLGYNRLGLGYSKEKVNNIEDLQTIGFVEKKNKSDGINKYIFDRLKEIKEINIFFYGIFYNETKVSKKAYSVYNSVDMDELTGKVKIQFNDIFTKQLAATKDYVLLDIEEFRSLKPTTASLYQFAIENAQASPVEKNIKLLCEDDLHWGAERPYKLYKLFSASADEIKGKTDKVLVHEYNSEMKNVKFKIGPRNKVLSSVINPEIKAIIEKCPHILKGHPDCIKTFSKYYEKFNSENNLTYNNYSWGYVVIMANVEYFIEKYNGSKLIEGKEWGYLISCLEKNYGKNYIPMVTSTQDSIKNKDLISKLGIKLSKEERAKIKNIYDNLDYEAKMKLKGEADNKILNSENFKLYDYSNNPELREAAVNTEITKILCIRYLDKN